MIQKGKSLFPTSKPKDNIIKGGAGLFSNLAQKTKSTPVHIVKTPEADEEVADSSEEEKSSYVTPASFTTKQKKNSEESSLSHLSILSRSSHKDGAKKTETTATTGQSVLILKNKSSALNDMSHEIDGLP